MIGEANKTELSYIAEATAGSTPANPAMQLLRFLNESLEMQQTTQESEEIRTDRGVSDLIIVDQTNGGSIGGEFSGLTYDDFLEAALMADATWSTDTVGPAITIAATATGFSDSGNGFAIFEVGQFVKVSGFANASINDYYRITSVAAGAIGTYPVPPATEAAGASVTITGSTITSGATDYPFTFQKELGGIATPTYINFRGSRISTMTMSMSSGSKVPIEFGIMAQSSEVTTAQLAGRTELAKTTTGIMNAVSNAFDLVATSASMTTSVKFTDLNLSYDNTMRELKAVGTLGAVDIRAGTINATSSFNPYFEDKQMLDAFKNNEAFHLSWRLTSADGYTYVFSMPNVKFTTQSLAAGARDTDMILNAQAKALLNTQTAAMRIDKFAP